jgi:glycosyltransferase involved in cell wall biosynthesis
MKPRLSVILPTHKPHPGRLACTLAGLAAQTLPADDWELIVVDNASPTPLRLPTAAALNARVVSEPQPGLTPARLRGIAEAGGEVLVFVDDDNVLAPGYLAAALAAFRESPALAIAGGPVRPDFEAPPADWTREFWPLLALQDHGEATLVAVGGVGLPYPPHAPVGAGLCVRRAAALAYAAAVRADPRRAALDRRGHTLTSGGDNDLIFTAYHAGGAVGYFPELALSHLIPSTRLATDYLTRLNRAIQRSWVLVLALHGQRPWPAINHATLKARLFRAWWRARAWRGPVEKIRAAGLMGRLEGQAELTSEKRHA